MRQNPFGPLPAVSVLTLGGGGLGMLWGETTFEECVATVRAGVEAGITLLDLAPRYGNGKAERVVVNVNGPLRANNSEVLREAVLGGLGIGLLPDFSAAMHLGPRQLVPLLPQWRPLGFFGDGIYAIRPWSPQVPRAVQCLVDHLRGALGGGFQVGRR